nr:NAD(P)/FAD-dependent oxidoreductase [uncultured bacterium]AXL05817.1 NAD(P)/FAD-dependent oxidoreductase [uncultured bacterium]
MENFLSVVHAAHPCEGLVSDAWTRSAHLLHNLVRANAVVVGDSEYEVDCVIFATGFQVGVSGVVSGLLTRARAGWRAAAGALG